MGKCEYEGCDLEASLTCDACSKRLCTDHWKERIVANEKGVLTAILCVDYPTNKCKIMPGWRILR